MFGIIYKNTQFHLLKDNLLSLGFSFIYPFVIYLLPGCCRIPSLSARKKTEIVYINLVNYLQYCNEIQLEVK